MNSMKRQGVLEKPHLSREALPCSAVGSTYRERPCGPRARQGSHHLCALGPEWGVRCERVRPELQGEVWPWWALGVGAAEALGEGRRVSQGFPQERPRGQWPQGGPQGWGVVGSS